MTKCENFHLFPYQVSSYTPFLKKSRKNMIFTKMTYFHKDFFSTRIVQDQILINYLEIMNSFGPDKIYLVVVTTKATTVCATKQWRPKVPTRRHFVGQLIIKSSLAFNFKPSLTFKARIINVLLL